MNILKKFFLVFLFCSLFILNAKAYTLPDGNVVPDIPSIILDNNYPFMLKLKSNNITLYYCTTDNFIANTSNDSYSGYVYLKNYSNCYNATTSATTSYNTSSKTHSYSVTGSSWSSFTKVSSSSEFISLKNGVVNSIINDFFVQGLSGFNAFFPINFVLDLKNGNILNLNNAIIESYNNFLTEPTEPTYSYTSKVLENGNVELTFSFEDYDNSDSTYAFTIENEVSGEEYGVENPFSPIFPKVIPYGNSYTITIPYDTYLYITLAKYNQVDNSTLYTREEIFTDVIDINNIVFANPSIPYYSIDYQSQTSIQGQFNNTQNNDSCYVKFSDDSTTRQVSCTNSFSVDFDFNGYLTFYVERNNDIIYNRNINVLGNTINDYPYLTYNIQKQDFYSVITFNVVNDDYDVNMSYRYSLDNGSTWSEYQLIDKTPPTYNINIFSNSNVIFEIANARDPDNIIVYDSKSVYVVIDISTASGLNSSTDNIIDKFISLISLNDNLINYVNLFWNDIKNSKIFLPIMIPFISSIICAIIYLIRRK